MVRQRQPEICTPYEVLGRARAAASGLELLFGGT